MDDRTLFRYPPDYRVGDFKTVLDWSAYPGAGGGFQGAVEMCNNNGGLPQARRRRDVPVLSRDRDEKDVTAAGPIRCGSRSPASSGRTRWRPTRWPRR